MTTSGKSVYDSINSKVREVENSHEALSRKLYDSERKINALVQQREEAFSQLATFYLPELDAQAVKETLHELQSEVQRLFQEKQQHRRTLEGQIQQSQERQAELRAELSNTDADLEKKAEQRESLRKEIAQFLDHSDSYPQLHAQAQQAQQQLEQNRRRAETFKGEARDKLEAYKENRLFMYLLERGYGTSDYWVGGLAKSLDAWVARKINFEEAVKNYNFLVSMPKAIQQEVGARQKEVDDLVDKIKGLEDEAAKHYGLPAVLKEGEVMVKRKNGLLEDLDKEQAKVSQYSKERKELDGTKDQYHRTALDKLKSYLKGSSIAELKDKASATPNPEDDHLVDKIIQMDTEIKEAKRGAKEVQKQQANISTQLGGLQSISRHYASKDYESSRSYFDSGFDINTFLLGYLAGNYSADEVNSNIDRHHHFKPRQTYSSYSGGGYSSSRRRSSSYDDDSWSGGSSYGGGSSWSSGSDSSFGGGSFSSGGGFGGGSFSSGSGF